ncbi:AAA family ATPase midasin [Aspergillus glaucus CBS 516.65]|uniref:Midasin n=1 Tax=Aspergillus glaucus CBS 516.65 TaxID=1160497 RepID=A0A1L9V978_ASPGL|nr:hypothetical protein ASPGLDRAFT_38864 [Aspergillus glaucus CBS 516.65]OJJ80494.1 hypothetical protein ASPGLDRAFT_38864 [Aspergillus glaucus CBS 516.65]
MDGRPAYEGALDEPRLFQQLPNEIVELIRAASGTQYLNALAVGALKPQCTEGFFALYKPIFVDIAARWLQSDIPVNQVDVLSAFARILPFAPYLRSFASQYTLSRAGPLSKELTSLQLDDTTIRTLLLAIFRLLSFDLEVFSKAVSPSQIQSLFRHSDRSIRYLAVRCFALYMHAADAATEKMVQRHVGDEPIKGEWEGIPIDYRCLGLWEERRWEMLEKQVQHARLTRPDAECLSQAEMLREFFTARTGEVSGVLIPKLNEVPVPPSAIVRTPTAVGNLRKIAKALLDPQPLLLVGLPNSGKTSLINDIAAIMGQSESMVTLHLNEQTDAKSLLGMYSTSPATGSFAWQPGVLTKAAREGRWILIEDLNRAPSEVIGLILPIIEKGELTIASRKERIKCADGFKIIATMKSSYNIAGEEIAPATTILGSRLWQRVQVDSLSVDEIRVVIMQKFPLLESRVPVIMDVYQRLCSAFHGNLAVRSSQGRTPGFRDLIKLCSRLHRRLERLGAKTGYEPTPEGTEDEIFLDTVDIFLRYIPEKSMESALAAVVAEALQMSPQRARFALQERTPVYSDQGSNLILGRENCRKMKVPSTSASKLAAASSRFASTRSALKLMEQVAASVQMAEPTLLVGETGIGKTTVVQQLATLMRQKLTVVNLSQQSESSDLLGGFKPVNIRTMAVPMLDEFTTLFELTFSAKKNQKFLMSVSKSVANGNWARLVNLWHEAVRLAEGVFNVNRAPGGDEQPSKKRKLDSPKYQLLRQRWQRFTTQLSDFEAQVSQGDAKFAFAFVQGKIVRALRNGEWVLLDEVNLASPDTLENIASLLHHGSEGSPSVLLSEAGDVERVFGHPDFRIFGAMNPATDAGKRDLPPGLRSRFTEFYVHSPDNDLDDLFALIQKYLGDLTIGDSRTVPDLAQLYMETKKLSTDNKLTDGAGQRPHFSIRTLVRALIYAVDHSHIYGLRRAIFEGFCMSFLTVLSQESERLLTPLLEKYIFSNTKNARALLGQTPRPPNDGNNYVQFKHYWMRQGHLQPEQQPHYIITPFIEKNLKNLVRASSTRRFPVLLQGPTSAGKTSMIEYLAKVSGNKFVRINNHEHTDLQEYLGSYVSGDDGTLHYQEGILVEALRHGYWIVLDELNLAPSDVLEAMNRLLDDNRELFIPETQEVIHPHPNFMLFATQNPAGLYGGRKVLSRAFRNRFLELHFDDIPENELEFILKERSQIAPSFCARIVAVYRKLSLLRQTNRLFEQKNSFATLRDLFRWALRPADDRDQLAVNGFMLLAERVRNPQERAAVKSVIEEVMRVKIDEDIIYSSRYLEKCAQGVTQLAPGIVWTKAMRRLFVLVSKAIQNNEPVLLVGETGCGKTQLCQAVAEIYGKELFVVNAHVNLETGDLIGAQRPVRNRSAIEKQLSSDLRTVLGESPPELASLDELKHGFAALNADQLTTCDQELVRRVQHNIVRSNALFEWTDGSLISAMKSGQFFLLDEISLADDSVLERLNSVLEPQRSILLAEKGPIDSMVVADGGFQFLSTMNPGGDYGKRELSAALRNRMTEIWAPQLSEDEDILPILQQKLSLGREDVSKAMLQFAKWFKWIFQSSSTNSLSIRDLLAWVDFVNKCQTSDPLFAIVQGAAMVFIDTLGANPAAMLAMSLHDLEGNRQRCLNKLQDLFAVDASGIYWQKSTVTGKDGYLHIGPFDLPVNRDATPDPDFIMDAPTTIANSVRIARGLQSSKPILLEGSPGVGKTTLVAALAKALGKPLTRINLSEQTDLTDLFGSDVPVEGGDVGQFTWRDAPFLQAMQRGDWVLLDEMNLASQSVLEGLNSCLDHRQLVYVAELDQTFKRHPNFVLFAAQNPHHQGGGRKGLPASFVNRFTVVYADSFTDTDLKRISARLFPGSPQVQTDRLVDFVSLLNIAITQERRLGAVGGPWEVNLRDIQRWLQLADRGDLQIPTNNFLDVIIAQRFRSPEDRELVSKLYKRTFTDAPTNAKSYYHNLTPEYMQVGLGTMRRDQLVQRTPEPQMKVLPRDLSILESLMLCIEQSWPSILVGSTGCGKTTLIRKIAAVNGAQLVELALSADTDTMDLIGGFEQIDHNREVSSLVQEISRFIQQNTILSYSSDGVSDSILPFLELHEMIQGSDVSLEALCAALSTLLQSYQDPTLEQFLSRAQYLFNLSRHSDKMKVGFEWTEGVLTQAVQHGHWVVLDNANLCNPSVLDRLNSLTESNGTLILNEQRTEDGSARTITPHPNFRLFLTMDPRHGELSRAMRNRCVEICFLHQETDDYRATLGPAYTCESFLYRLRTAWNFESQPDDEQLAGKSYEVRLNHLSARDLLYLQSSLGSWNSEPFTSILRRYLSLVHDNAAWKPLEQLKAQVVLGGAPLAIQGESQPLHPLVNEPLALISGSNAPLPWLNLLARLQECKLDLYYLKQGLQRADESGKLLKPSEMTRLERSLASGRIPALMKDATQPVGFFLSDCGQGLYDFIQQLDHQVFDVPAVASALRAVVDFCADIFKVSEAKQVDEGEFQIYLQIGRELCAALFNSSPFFQPLAVALSQYLGRFQAEWALTMGLSMQKIWDTWRPATPATQGQLDLVMQLEAVAHEFGNLATKTRLELSQLGRVRNSLIDAQRAILIDGADGELLVESLKQTVTELTSAVRHTDSSQYPYFAGDFEALCQYHDVSMGNKEADTAVGTIMPLLAGRPARPVDASNLQSQIPGVLHKLAQLSGSSDSTTHAPAMGGTASLSLLEKIMFVDTTSLGQMEFLEAEKQALSKAVALTSHEIAMDQAKVLRQALARIALESVNLHKELFEPQSLEYMLTVLRTIEKQGSYNDWQPSSCRLEKSLQDDHYFKAFAEKALPGLVSTLVAGAQNQEEDVRNAGVATIELATILLRLYVPDKPFDPSLGLVVQRKRHAQRVSELTTKSEAISAFEVGFTGQSSNMRHEILQGELRDLGAAPPPSSVTRPQNSSISLLQGEFSNLITSVLDRHPEAMVTNGDAMKVQEAKLLRDNVQQLSRRLSTHYRSYDDITTPVVRLLQVLDLGMYLASSQSGEVQILKAVSEITPFLGGVIHPESTLDGARPSPASNRVLDIRFHELSSLGVAANADSMVLQSQKGRDALRRIFEQFHYLWKTKLREDQEEQAQKSNLYQYRGSWEDEEQVDETELREMFPTYDTDVVEEGKEPNRFDPKAISRRLASLHAKLFESDDTERTLSAFVKESARLLGTLWSESKTAISPIHPKEHLPGVLLLLDDMISGEAPKYNFYTDSNLTEARKLIALTVSVQSRFIQLQTAWPDHAVIQDVILYCKDIFQFKHSEPVAKFLTKVEKLHGLVYEWQLVASREYSAASLYDELTSTIINWRRLELSTWAKLLDIEKEKCDQDVSSWWFVAYEAIIAAPLQMAESGEADMGAHIQEVIATLEQFFLSTTLGQYSERLRLVANFRSLLLLYVQDYPSLGQLVSGLQNFLEHYKPFEPLVNKLLVEKRAGLEKDIKEQIQLASWKDTNIVALRESAKRSHHKLFKLVRKYREVLAGPVQPTLEQGMSDYSEEPSLAASRADFLPTAVIPEALDMCQKDSALWLNRAPRFKNTDTTVNNMTQLYSSMPSDFDIAEDIGSFVSYVIEGINDFKSQTPKILTEDNKEDVQHLKVQKRRFFADTLRQMLEMGIKRNASTSLLETQASSAQVLATIATLDISPVSSHLIQNANSYFHRFLDLLPRTRQASHHYSEELSNVEASRGMGSIEHLLFTLRKQRGVISPALSNLSSFKSTIAKMSNLWQSGLNSLSASPRSPADGQDLSKIVAWLTPILGMAAEIVDVHSRFSRIDATAISKDLRAWKATSDRLHKSLVNLPTLPSSVSSQQHQALVDESWSSLNQLTIDLAKWTSERPDLSFALDQITPWIKTKTDSTMQQNGTMAFTVQDFDASLLNAVDKILVGLQKLKEVPAALTSEGTLARSDEFFSRTIKSVRLSEITSSLESVLDTLHSGADIPYASALIASVLPITNKYYLICEDLTDRFISVHRETCKMSYVLAKSFMTIASEGFCQPAEASTGEESKSGQLESGTGLGDGEGAEDISKDVADDEDLSELAQQQNEEAKEDQEDSGDAVNMDQEEMQGESGERKEGEEDEENESGEEGEDDIDEEVGSVNDLDTDALDEKMWDGERDEQQKETETQEGKGATESEEQTAGEKEQEQKDQEKGEKSKEGEEEEEEEDEEEEDPDDEGEAVGREDMDVTDPHAKEEEALDLPEEMQLDGEEQGDKDEGDDDDGMDELSDMGAAPEEEQAEQQGENAEEDAADMDQTAEEQGEGEGEGENEEEKPEDAEANEAEGDDEANAPGEDEEQPEETDFLAQRDENEAAGEEVAPSEAVNGGLGADQDQNQDKGASGDAQQEDGAADPANTEQQTGAAQDGEDSKRSRDAGGADDNTKSEKPEMQAFKKMGDILEQWHRRQKEIMESSKQEDEAEQQLPEDTDMADADFEHLADQDDVADTQALGQASEEQAKALDQNKGVESDIKPNDEALPDVSNDQQEDLPENNQDEMQVDNDAAPTEREGAGAMIPGNAQTQERTTESLGQQDLNEELDEVDSHLAAIHLSSTLPPLTPRDEAQRLWSQYESATNDLSLSLTEQLRLILAPTLATKLRGDFRTGKRLNIKRIIPYIASQYKRDKIWMRRSIPSKRNYQIMLAVDDSKSMLESGSGQLAFETLALVAKSLSMLEAGDLCVLGFGNEDHVRVAHEFGKPFSSDAGTEVFQHFSYQQTGTNVRKLIADSIALFREARFKRSPGSGSADLWQLELIISDGICEDHDTIRRLVRQALEERIMVVFIIVDAVKGSSILDLSQASFEPDVESGTGEMKLKMKRYLEDFPFPYYLVVRDVRELPAVLATALKQWFAEVVDVSS